MLLPKHTQTNTGANAWYAFCGRCLTEGTLKLVTSLWLMLTCPDLDSIDTEQKRKDFRRIKQEFNRKAKFMAEDGSPALAR